MCRQSHDSIARPCICCQWIICHLNTWGTMPLSLIRSNSNTKFKTSNSLDIFAYILLLAANFDYAGSLETIEEIICNHIYLCQMHMINNSIWT